MLCPDNTLRVLGKIVWEISVCQHCAHGDCRIGLSKCTDMLLTDLAHWLDTPDVCDESWCRFMLRTSIHGQTWRT